MAVPTTVRDLGEDRLVSAVLSVIAESSRTSGAALATAMVGAGDDAAVLPAGGPTVLSTDTLVEHVDFRRDWSSGEDVGAKAVAAGLADIAAMGAVPEAVLVSLTVPADTDAEWVLALARGAAVESSRAGAAVIGGDVAAGGEIVVTVTATGRLVAGARAVLRSGARPGDVVALAGSVGESAAGLALLSAGAADAGAAAVARTDAGRKVLACHRRPEPPYPAGPAAALAGATAMIDVSDGLVRDARRIADASGAVLDLDPVPTSDAVHRVAQALAADAVEWVLTGGEDHALLATFPQGAVLPGVYRLIGRVRSTGGEEPGVQVGGRPWSGSGGFTHFRG